MSALRGVLHEGSGRENNKAQGEAECFLVLQTTTRVQYKHKARAKGTYINWLLCEETILLASVMLYHVIIKTSS